MLLGLTRSIGMIFQDMFVCGWFTQIPPQKNPDASFHFHLVVSSYAFSFTLMCWALTW